MYDFLFFSMQTNFELKCDVDSDVCSFVHVTPSETPMPSSTTTVIDPPSSALLAAGNYQLCTYVHIEVLANSAQ